jgi:hypothetical protein
MMTLPGTEWRFETSAYNQLINHSTKNVWIEGFENNRKTFVASRPPGNELKMVGGLNTSIRHFELPRMQIRYSQNNFFIRKDSNYHLFWADFCGTPEEAIVEELLECINRLPYDNILFYVTHAFRASFLDKVHMGIQENAPDIYRDLWYFEENPPKTLEWSLPYAEATAEYYDSYIEKPHSKIFQTIYRLTNDNDHECDPMLTAGYHINPTSFIMPYQHDEIQYRTKIARKAIATQQENTMKNNTKSSRSTLVKPARVSSNNLGRIVVITPKANKPKAKTTRVVDVNQHIRELFLDGYNTVTINNRFGYSKTKCAAVLANMTRGR